MHYILFVLLTIWFLGWILWSFTYLIHIKGYFSEFNAQAEQNYRVLYEMQIGGFLEALVRFLVIILIQALWPIKILELIEFRKATRRNS